MKMEIHRQVLINSPGQLRDADQYGNITRPAPTPVGHWWPPRNHPARPSPAVRGRPGGGPGPVSPPREAAGGSWARRPPLRLRADGRRGGPHRPGHYPGRECSSPDPPPALCPAGRGRRRGQAAPGRSADTRGPPRPRLQPRGSANPSGPRAPATAPAPPRARPVPAGRRTPHGDTAPSFRIAGSPDWRRRLPIRAAIASPRRRAGRRLARGRAQPAGVAIAARLRAAR